jgi:uncharacterized protein YeaC (DUF1315 family)
MNALASGERMDYREIVENLKPEVYERLKSAVETGRWPDGREVTAAQREHCLRAVIAWGERHLPPDERVGYIDRGRKATPGREGPQPLRWREGSDGT